MKLPAGILGYCLNYRVRDNGDKLVNKLHRQKQSHSTAMHKGWRVKTHPGRKILPSGLSLIKTIKSLKAFSTKPVTQQPPAKPDTSLLAIAKGTAHGSYQKGDTLLHGVPHIQQGSPNGCLDACNAMLLRHFDCPGAAAIQGAHHNGVFVQEDTGRSLFSAMNSEAFTRSLYDNKLEQTAITQPDKATIQKNLAKGPLLASIRFANGLAQHAVLVVGMIGDNVVINDPWHGGHQIKSLSWLKKNLTKSPTALSLVSRMDDQSFKAPDSPKPLSGKASKLL